ncbi:helix-turn-helix domain-containing protein [Acuticoccus yangtzensis]|uniref:helix-turn-helix domain-containing protein n=1 Tax=Acuticoccus yangtzensis TaxID=1443441 RepID=UPI000949A3FC|nr:helix-turn-helix transcriptional regulator [Acuticoccus yangtzensis]
MPAKRLPSPANTTARCPRPDHAADGSAPDNTPDHAAHASQPRRDGTWMRLEEPAAAARTAPGDPAAAAPLLDPPAERPVAAYVFDLTRGGGRPVHQHGRGQFVSVVEGSMAVSTDEGTYVVPAHRALWLPAGTAHRTRHLSSTRLRTLYVDGAAGAALPAHVAYVHMTPLIGALIDAVVALPAAYPLGGPEERMIAVLIDQIAAAEGVPLRLPLPRAPELQRLAEAIMAGEAEASVGEIASALALSVRTLERRFKAQTGMTLRDYRTQARLFRAVQLLAAGQSVTRTAEAVGFESPSTFIALFKATLGETPGVYLRARQSAAQTATQARTARRGA